METFFLIVFLSMIYEHTFDPICPRGLLMSFLHHILSVFMLTGPFLFNEDLLILSIWFFVWLGYRFVGKCITTIKYNEICKKDSQSEFKNIFSLEKFIFDASYIQWIVLLFSLYKITTLKAKQ